MLRHMATIDEMEFILPMKLQNSIALWPLQQTVKEMWETKTSNSQINDTQRGVFFFIFLDE